MSALELKVPPVLVTVLCALLMWLISGHTPGIILSPWVKIPVALLLAGIAGYAGLAGVAAFRGEATTVNPLKPDTCSSLVTSGIYRRTRNPMYLALMLALAAWGFYLANLFSLLMVAVFIFYMNRFQIEPEERALETIFGSEFNDYKEQVRRWV